MKNSTAVLLTLSVVSFLRALALYLAMMCLGWMLWTSVLPVVWPTGPVGLIHPGFGLFLVEWTLIGLVVAFLKSISSNRD